MNKTTIIKKYNNRKLYNYQTKCYISNNILIDLVKNHTDFVVIDHQGGDITIPSILHAVEKAKQYPTPVLRVILESVIAVIDEKELKTK